MTFYRETEFRNSPIGMIPRGWEVTELSDASLLVTDGSHFSPKHQNSGYPLATVANMRENDIDVDSCYRITKEDYEKLVVTGDKPEVDDVLFSKDGTVGQCIVFSQKVDLIVLSSIAIIRPNQKKANPYFLKYMLQSPATVGRISGSKTGSAIKRIILRDLNSIKIALPKKLEEQKRIVEILGVADSVIQLADEVIAKTERLKNGLIQQLLTRGIGHTDYKNTPIGQIPKEWRLGKLVDFSKTKDSPVQTGPFGAQLHASDYAKNGVPLILIKNVSDSQIIEKNMPQVAEKKAAELARYRLKAGDIVFSRVGSVGRAAVIKKHQEGWLVSGQMLRVRLENPEIDNRFLSYAIVTTWFQNALASRTVGATRKSINTEILSNLPMIVPDIPEQQRIANILLDVEKKLELERKEKIILERVKLGLMDLLLTGKVRIKVD